MSQGPVLVIGLDPYKIPEYPPEPLASKITEGQQLFADRGIDADLCLVDAADEPEAVITAALTARDYACVVIGGGIRRHEPGLLLFEATVNLVRRHAPDAAIAFNSGPSDSADAAARWLD